LEVGLATHTIKALEEEDPKSNRRGENKFDNSISG